MGLAVMVGLAVAAHVDVRDARRLVGSYHWRGATIVDPPPGEPRDTHLVLELEGSPARELYERLGTMVGHLETVGKNLKQAGDAYDRFIGSLESKVLPGARRFKELGVNTTEDLEAPEPVRLALRSVTKPELTGRLPEDADEPKTGFIK